MKIIFFSEYSKKDGRFCAFGIVSREPIKGIEMEKGPQGGWCYTYPPNLPRDLLSSLPSGDAEKPEEAAVDVSAESYPPVSIDDLARAIKNCDVLCVSFGAGISGGYVPTLEESCNTFNLQKIRGSDAVTDKSMSDFARQLQSFPDDTLKNVAKIWEGINLCEIQKTPAHEALSQLITKAKGEGKKIFVYTDNVDGIHHRCSIDLARTESSRAVGTNTSNSSVIYPSVEDVAGKTVASLFIGQSFDFDGVQSSIYTVAGRHAKAVHFFSLNINSQPLLVREGLDVNALSKLDESTSTPGPDGSIDISSFRRVNLPAKVVQGDVHKKLPEIFSAYFALESTGSAEQSPK